MGANEKYEATYHGGEYGEILDSSRLNYALSKDPGNGRTTEEWWAVKDEAFKEFDRAIAKIRAEAKREALTDVAHVLEADIPGHAHENGQIIAGRNIIRIIRARANQYKEAPNA
mgnify:CR=1 FL=1